MRLLLVHLVSPTRGYAVQCNRESRCCFVCQKAFEESSIDMQRKSESGAILGRSRRVQPASFSKCRFSSMSFYGSVACNANSWLAEELARTLVQVQVEISTHTVSDPLEQIVIMGMSGKMCTPKSTMSFSIKESELALFSLRTAQHRKYTHTLSRWVESHL